MGEAVEFYQDQFTEKENNQEYDMLQNIPKLVTYEHNEVMTKLPSIEEVKKVVFTLNGDSLNGDSVSGHDGFTGRFFKKCWDIIGEYFTRLVKAFFCGQEFPKFITHTNLVLIPNKEFVQELEDLRPISLSSFTKKVISIVLHEKIVKSVVEYYITQSIRICERKKHNKK